MFNAEHYHTDEAFEHYHVIMSEAVSQGLHRAMPYLRLTEEERAELKVSLTREFSFLTSGIEREEYIE
eukprot:gene1030-12250_t